MLEVTHTLAAFIIMSVLFIWFTSLFVHIEFEPNDSFFQFMLAIFLTADAWVFTYVLAALPKSYWPLFVGTCLFAECGFQVIKSVRTILSRLPRLSK